MAYLNNFDANTVDPATSFDPIPAGKYIAAITGSEMKPTKNCTGHYLELSFDILDGQYKGRKVWARLNLDNPNPTTVEIARGQLSAICRAVGVMKPQDSAELHDLLLSIKVVCKKREDTGEMINQIKGYEKQDAALSSAPTLPPSAIITHAATPPPWQG